MTHKNTFEPDDAGFDGFDSKIRQVLRNEGLTIPKTIEDVRHAKARLRSNPVTVPPHLRNASAVYSKINKPESQLHVQIEKCNTLTPKAEEKTASKRASSEFVEAILIAQITRLAATPQFPLGHLRQNKMAYFSHRKAEEDVEDFFCKQPAGPYSSRAKYQGPERIAQENGYIKKVKVGNYSGFVTGENITKIDQYITRHPVCGAVEWVVNKFRYKKNEQLELLATVDFAALELIQNKKLINMENIKNVIASSKNWAEKLKRDIFSDENISHALSELCQLFPKTYQ